MLDKLKGTIAHYLAPTDKVPNSDETAMAEAYSTLYGSDQFSKYNPDDLITTKGYKIYAEMMQDEQVKAVVNFKRDAITSRKFSFKFADDVKLSDTEKEKRIAVFTGLVESFPGTFIDALNAVMTSRQNGFSITEKVYAPVKVNGVMWVGPKKLKLKPYDTFEFYTDDYGNILRFVQKVGSGNVDNELDLKKFIYMVNNPHTDEHYGRSDLWECYRAWWSKDVTIRMNNIFLERMAGGLIVAQQKEGVTLSPQQRADIKNILNRIQTKTGILIPNEVDLEIHYPKGSNDTYINSIAAHDKAIAKALLVPNLLGITEQGDVGSYSQSQTQLEAFLWTLDQGAGQLEQILNEQLFAELGEINFLDGIYPRFTFDPISETMKMGIIKMWQELVSGGAVDKSESDETHLRQLLNFPEKEVPDDTDNPNRVDPTTALNGAQVSALLDVIEAYTLGKMPNTTAVKSIVASFPLSEEQAIDLLKDIPDTFDIEKVQQPEPIPGQQPNPNDPNAPNPNDPNAPNINPDDEQEGVVDDEENMEEHTLIGKVINIRDYTRAVKRVSFSVIDRESTAMEQKHITLLNKAANKLIIGLTSDIDEVTPEAIDNLKVSSRAKRAINKVYRTMALDAWALGKRHADIEIGKAGRGQFDKERFTAGALTEEAAEAFLESRAFEFSKTFSDKVLKQISSIMFNGIKFQWTLDEIVNRIEQELETVLKPQIATAARTSIFEAINEARFSFFNSPDLENFVEAVEYSAILDGRTTPICRHLDDRVYPKRSDVWAKYRPPNHFNCRSILVAVTINDKWQEAKQPKLDPMEGFG